ncbi:MAG: hypothetical protein LBB98_03015 [Treponema sp.]|nr:hypothetical protein [Treponema sp.]
MSYANKRHSPYVDINLFLAFLEKYAIRVSREHPEWKKWTSDTAVKFYSELSPLIEAKKCEVTDSSGSILMLDFYAELINPIYKDMEKNVDIPFPDEKSLGIVLPDDECQIVNIKEDMARFMQKSSALVMPVIKIIFPDDIPPALVPADVIPRPLMDASLLKLRNFLRTQNNKVFFQRRLLPQMHGRESFLRDAINMLEIRPLDCILQIQNAAEFTSFFWASFCSAVKNELKKKKEFLSIDIAAFQAVHIIEAFSAIFKETVTKRKERDQALKALEANLDKPPYLYTMGDFFKFTDNSGNPLLGQYSEDDLKNYLDSKTTAVNAGELADLLIYRNKKGEQIFINKQKVFPLCAHLSGKARIQIRKAIGHRWSDILRNFRSEPAMEKDEEFNQLLTKYAVQFVPSLMSILHDKKTFLVQCEIEQLQGGGSPMPQFYSREGNLLPMGTLLRINRKDLLIDTRILLPFWYSIPILTSILAFFKRLGSDGKKKAVSEEPSYAPESSRSSEEKVQAQAIKAVASHIVQTLSVDGKTPDAAMADLENSWQILVDKEAKKHLITDIKSLIRDRLRRTLRLKLNQKFTVKIIEDLAVSIYVEVPSLKQLGDEDSITTYIKLYMAKLLLEIKF